MPVAPDLPADPVTPARTGQQARRRWLVRWGIGVTLAGALADGTTMTWLLVSDTVVRDHGKSSTSELSDGQLVFVGGPESSGARDARLIAVRTGRSKTTSVS